MPSQTLLKRGSCGSRQKEHGKGVKYTVKNKASLSLSKSKVYACYGSAGVTLTTSNALTCFVVDTTTPSCNKIKK